MTTTLPDPGTWVFDTSHSSVEFIARHLMVSKVRGGFGAFSGTVVVADPIEESTVDVSIEAASFTSGDENRDGHVRGEDFLDVERFPPRPGGLSGGPPGRSAAPRALTGRRSVPSPRVRPVAARAVRCDRARPRGRPPPRR